MLFIKRFYFVWFDSDWCIFRPKRNALFLVDLQLDHQGVHYSTNLNNFEMMLVGLFDKGIQSTQNVPQLEKVSVLDITLMNAPFIRHIFAAWVR